MDKLVVTDLPATEPAGKALIKIEAQVQQRYRGRGSQKI
jgi:hypothetical protein